MKIKLRAVSALSAIALAFGAGPVLLPQPAHAAGFMQNSFKNFTDNEDIDDSVKSVIKFFAALFYLIPIIGPVAAIVGVAVASRSQSDDAPRTVGIVILVVAVIVGAMWIYDSKMVGNVNGYIPRPLQFAFLDAVKAQKG